MIRLLIIDDSATMRALLAQRLSREPDVRIVGMAENAAAGRTMIRELDPDVVTLDIEMPGMNGLDFLEKVMTLRPTPVIVVSSLTHKGTAEAARALALGAVDCFAKSDLSQESEGQPGDRRLADMVRVAAQADFRTTTESAGAARAEIARHRGGPARLIAVGASTGGVEALQALLADLPRDVPPIVMVQHVNAQFAPAIARTLDEASPLRVKLAEHGEILQPAHAYLAPGGERHLEVRCASGQPRSKLVPGEPRNGHRPSVDTLFLSVARELGGEATGIVLTGMGSDGAEGMAALAARGAATLAQDQGSCVVFGMPRAAIERGAAQVVAPPAQIARELARSMA